MKTIKLKLTEKREVYLVGEEGSEQQLKVNAQATKGEGKEVVDIEKIVGSEYQKWVSLSKLEIGINEIELKPRKALTTNKVELTLEEQKLIKEYQDKINEIIENAKNRKPKFNKLLSQSEVANLSQEEKLEYQTWLENYIESLKA